MVHKENATAPVWARNTRRALTATARWTATEGGRTTLYSTLPPLLVSGCANLAAHQLYQPVPGLSAAVVALGAGYLGVKGLAHKWAPVATYTFLGLSATTVNMGVTVAGSGWVDAISLMMFGATALGGRLAYLHATIERRAKARTEQAKAEHMEAKTALEEAKAETERINAQIKAAKLAKASAPEYRPDLRGHTAEESALRTSFWDVHKAELLSCLTEPTLTGYTATVGLPTTLPRDAVRQSWDRVATAMRASGRFILSDGERTNELCVKFVDGSRTGGQDVTWSPDLLSPDPSMMSIGVNTETGEPVLIQADERTLICGASGTGKSWASRAMMAHAHTYGDLVLIDGKGEEGTVWEKVARVAIEADDILAAVDELHAEMNRRRDLMRGRGISVWDGSQLTAVVDEGQVVIALINSVKAEAADRMQRLRELSSLGRSRGVVLWWATQKPVMSGSAPGIDNLIAPNMLQRFSLRVADEQEARTALDDCAHYGPNLIPDRKDMRGHGFLKGYGPSLIRAWTMDDAAVQSLPVSRWESPAPQGAASNADKVARYFIAYPDASNVSAAKELGVDEKTVRRYRKINGSQVP